MKGIVCRILGHRWSFPIPTDVDIARWVQDLPPLSGLQRSCLRCGLQQSQTRYGKWLSQ